MVYRKNPVDRNELRNQALERLRLKGISSNSALNLPDIQRLFEELEIHQIELELQNEHLSEARAQLELALNQSTELYDFSPVGNLLIDSAGNISKANLSGAHLLGCERSRLIGGKLALYLPDVQRELFNDLLTQSRDSGEVLAGELSLLGNSTMASHVQIHVAPVPDDLGWQIVLVDITERRRIEEQLRLNEARWKLALDAAGDGVWDWNFQTGEVLYSKKFIELFGYSESEFIPRKESWIERIHPDERREVQELAKKCRSGESVLFSCEYRILCKDGAWKWVLSRGAVISRSEGGDALRMIGTHVDISGRKKSEEALRVAVNFQQAVFDSLTAQVLVLDCKGTLIQANKAWRNYLLEFDGEAKSDFEGESYLDALSQLTFRDQGIVQHVKGGLTAVIEGVLPAFQLQQPFFLPSSKRWFSLKITPVHDMEERILVSHEDVTSLKIAELASTTLANIDALTGALSRLNFMSLAEQEVQRSIRYGLPLMVLMMDLDHFKKINDLYGHATGDAVLKSFVKTVSGVLRESDFMGRLGGEEFGVLLPNTTLEGGRALAQRIIDCVRSSQIDANGQTITYTVSIGAGCLSSQNYFSTLLGVADLALYRAKNGGRNRLEIGPSSL